MKKRKKPKKILYSFLFAGMIFILFLSGLAINNFGLGTLEAGAQSDVATSSRKDSDYDGITDQAEINKYRTDPASADTDLDGYPDTAEVLAGSNPTDPRDPADFLTAKDPVPAPSSVPWFITRSAAITAYFLMFFIIVLGTGMTTGIVYEIISPPLAWSAHKYLSISLGLAVLVHILSLLFDKFVNFHLLDILIPFHSGFRPLYVGLGIFGFYTLLIIIFSSLLTRLKFSFFWRAAHYLTYPLFIFIILHGILTGTDTKFPAMQIIYWSTGLVFAALLLIRLFFFHRGSFIKK